MWALSDDFALVFWIAVIPAFMAFGLILFAVREPARTADLRRVRNPLARRELALLGPAYWWVVGVAEAFTLAWFSEAFLILRAEGLGLSLMFVPLVLVALNIACAVSAFPVGVLSDRTSRATLLIVGLTLLVADDLVLAFARGVPTVLLGVVLWGLHMGFTQGLMATLGVRSHEVAHP